MFGGKHIVGYLPYFIGGNGIDTVAHFLAVLVFVVMQKYLCHTQCVVFEIIRCHTDFPDKMFLYSMQLGVR